MTPKNFKMCFASVMRRTIACFLFFVLLLLAGCQAAQPVATPTPKPSPTSAALATLPASPTPAGIPWPTQGWQTSSPEAEGIDAGRLAGAVKKAVDNKLNLDSLLVIRHGKLVSENYFPPTTAETQHDLWSVTKSITSTLVGIAVDKGLIDGVQHPVLDFFPDLQVENPDAQKSRMTLQNLLTMSAGLDWKDGDPAYQAVYQSSDWVKSMLGQRMVSAPGSVFNYCTPCSHILSAILQKVTGKSTRLFAEDNLFGPLGITSFAWDVDRQGIPMGGFGLKLTPRDMAKLGYLYLHNGEWDGKQIVSEKWVQDATRTQIAAGQDVGYGYQWWVEPQMESFSARGSEGQYIYVLPRLDLIVVTTATKGNLKDILSLIEKDIVPAVKE